MCSLHSHLAFGRMSESGDNATLEEKDPRFMTHADILNAVHVPYDDAEELGLLKYAPYTHTYRHRE